MNLFLFFLPKNYIIQLDAPTAWGIYFQDSASTGAGGGGG